MKIVTFLAVPVWSLPTPPALPIQHNARSRGIRGCPLGRLVHPSAARTWTLAISRLLRSIGGACFSLPGERRSPVRAAPAPYRRLISLKLTLAAPPWCWMAIRSEEHTSELQSLTNLVCRLLLEKRPQ